MRILAVQGSPNINGNTAALLDAYLQGAGEKGHQIERLQLQGKDIRPCLGCNYCRPQGKGVGQCVQADNMPYESLLAADLLVLASPAYWWGFNAQTKAFIDRMYAQPFNIWRHKRVKLIFTSFHPLPSMMAKSQDMIWNYMTTYMHMAYLGALEGCSGQLPIARQPELLARARREGFDLPL